MADWLRWQFIHECAETIAEHADMLGHCARTGNDVSARTHFECIRLTAKQLEKTLKEVEALMPIVKLSEKERAG